MGGARAVLGGLVVAVLLIAGVATLGLVSPRSPADWTRPSLVVARETGQPYVVLEATDPPVLRPVSNITSARLLLGPAASVPQIVPVDTIAEQEHGPPVGVVGAPDGVAEPARLVDSGWTACATGADDVAVALSDGPGARQAPGAGAVVRTPDGDAWVVAHAGPGVGGPAYAYRVPKRGGHQDAMLGALGLGPRAGAPVVPVAWLRLFPRGGPLGLESFGLTRVGERLPGAVRVGDYVVAGERALLLTADGPTPLDPWALAVYEHAVRSGSGSSARVAVPQRVDRAVLPGGDQVQPAYLSARWPQQPVRPLEGEPCAVLDSAPDRPPAVALAARPRSAGETASGSGRVMVEPGRGAHVVPAAWDGSGAGREVVIASDGRRHRLVGTDAAERLGYGDHAPPLVPRAWLRLLEPGVPLSVDAAARRVDAS